MFKAYTFLGEEFVRLHGQYINAGMPETTNSILRVGEGSSVLGIRVGVQYTHLTKFDVGVVRQWRGS